jgi:hypothetical protein
MAKMAKIKNSDLIEDNLLAPSIESAKIMITTLTELENQMKKNLEASKQFFSEQKKATSSVDFKKQAEETKKVADAEQGLTAIQKEKLKLEETLKKLNSDKIQQNEQLKVLISQQRASNKALAEEQLKQVGTLEKLNRENKKLTAERKTLNLETDKGRKRLQEINAQLDKNNKFIKSNVDSLSRQRLEIGNYKEQVSAALTESGLFGRQIAILTQLQGKFQAALKLTKISLVATGIGAIVVLLGSLIGAFASTQRGVDAFNKILVPLKSAFQGLLGIIQDLSFKAFDKFKDALKDPVQAMKDLGNAILDNLINRFKSLGVFTDAIILLFEGKWRDAGKKFTDATLQLTLGIENGTEALSNFGKQVSEESERLLKIGQQINDLQVAFEKLEIATTVPLAKANLELRKLQETSKNVLLTEEERIEALNKQLAILEFIDETESQLLQLRIDKLKLQQGLNDTNREGQLELQKLLAEQLEKEEAVQKRRNKIVAEQSTLFKTVLSQRQKENDAIRDVLKLKETEINQELILREISVSGKSLEEQRIERLEKELELREKITETVIRAGKIIDEFEKQAQKTSQENIALLDKEAQTRKRNIDYQRDLAAQGSQIAAEQLQFEEQKLAEAEERKREQIKREQEVKQLTALINSYWAAFERFLGDKDVKPEQAAMKALQEVGKGIATSKGVGLLAGSFTDANFIDGTENVSESLGNKGKVLPGLVDNYLGITKSGHAIAFDGDERIINPTDNKALGDISNKELVNIGLDYKSGRLGYFTGRINDKKGQDLSLISYKLDSVEKAIKSKPVQRVDVDGLGNMVERVITDTMTTKTTYIKRKGKI